MAIRTDADTRAKGAHFLVGEKAIARIVAAAALQPGESVLDIGAGAGALTRPLVAAVGETGRVMAIEKDPVLVEVLQAKFPTLEVVQGDALRIRLPDKIDAVVANPPYRIIPGLLARLLDHGFGRAVLVVPEELAQRLTAQPKSEAYGRLTVEIGLRAKVKLLLPLRRHDFDPPPEIASAVIEVKPKLQAEAIDAKSLDLVLAAAWGSKRKTLRHSLAPLADQLGVPPVAITEILEQTGTRERTALEISPWEFGELARRCALLQS